MKDETLTPESARLWNPKPPRDPALQGMKEVIGLSLKSCGQNRMKWLFKEVYPAEEHPSYTSQGVGTQRICGTDGIGRASTKSTNQILSPKEYLPVIAKAPQLWLSTQSMHC